MEVEDVDYERLEEFLRALAYSSRLELLHILRFPRALQDIRLSPGRLRPGTNPERAISRQALQEHLEKLMEIGVVVSRDAGGDLRARKEFLVNPSRLYLIMEEFRKVGTITASAPAATEATVGLGGVAPAPPEPGPKLVLVHGQLEGKAFPLRREGVAGLRGWVIGRKPTAQVNLEYDPYVSLENSEVRPDREDFLVQDLEGSRNGTWLNWRRLAPGEQARLEPGDVIGVGRSLLVFRQD